MTLHTRYWVTAYLTPTRQVLFLGTWVVWTKLSDYVVTLDGLSFASCTGVKDADVITDTGFSFDGHIDRYRYDSYFHLRNIVTLINMMQKNYFMLLLLQNCPIKMPDCLDQKQLWPYILMGQDGNNSHDSVSKQHLRKSRGYHTWLIL